MDNPKYNIVWLSYTSDSKYGKLFKIESDFSLPWLIFSDNEEPRKIFKTLPEYHLLAGVLLGYSPRSMDDKLKPTTVKSILEYLACFFGFDSIETFLLDSCCVIGEEHGCQARMSALFTSSYLLCYSSKIKSDLVNSIWFYVDSLKDISDVSIYFKTIQTTIKGINTDDIISGAYPVIILSDYIVSTMLNTNRVHNVELITLKSYLVDADCLDEFLLNIDDFVSSPLSAIVSMMTFFNFLNRKI